MGAGTSNVDAAVSMGRGALDDLVAGLSGQPPHLRVTQ